jgi:peptide/nickel transport system substrate-binding protein
MVKRLLLIMIIAIFAVGMISVSCGEPSPTPTPTATPTASAPSTPAPAQSTPAPAPSTTTPAPTTPPPATVDKYGGTLIRPLNVDAGPIGYPPESTGISGIAALPALESFARYRTGSVLEPRLATAWDVAPDGASITLTLRQGVKFHDGTDFNADAAKWNIDKNIEAGKITDVESVDVLGEYKIRANIKEYTNLVLENVVRIQVISPTAFDKNGIEWARFNPVGTGPFIFVSYVRDSKIVYKKNPDYWDKGKPYLDGYVFVILPDEMVRKIAFENGEIHTIRALGLTAQELQQKGFESLSMAGGTYILMPDSANPDSPLANKQVRLAISHAINREALANALGFGFIRPAYQIYPGFSAAIPNIEKQLYDQDKARALLAEAGYPDGFKTSIYCFLQVIPKEYISTIASMLNEVGIETTAEFPEMGRYMQLYLEGWEGMMGHALYATTNLNYPMQFYFGGIGLKSLQIPPGFEEAMAASLHSNEYDPLKMRALLQVIYDDVMMIPYVEETAIEFIYPGVHDTGLMEVQIEGYIPDETWLDPDLR